MLSDFQPFFGSFAHGYKQVLDSLVVDLQHGDIYLIFLIFILILANSYENLLARNRHDTLHQQTCTLFAP